MVRPSVRPRESILSWPIIANICIDTLVSDKYIVANVSKIFTAFGTRESVARCTQHKISNNSVTETAWLYLATNQYGLSVRQELWASGAVLAATVYLYLGRARIPDDIIRDEVSVSTSRSRDGIETWFWLIVNIWRRYGQKFAAYFFGPTLYRHISGMKLSYRAGYVNCSSAYKFTCENTAKHSAICCANLT